MKLRPLDFTTEGNLLGRAGPRAEDHRRVHPPGPRGRGPGRHDHLPPHDGPLGDHLRGRSGAVCGLPDVRAALPFRRAADQRRRGGRDRASQLPGLRTLCIGVPPQGNRHPALPRRADRGEDRRDVRWRVRRSAGVERGMSGAKRGVPQRSIHATGSDAMNEPDAGNGCAKPRSGGRAVRADGDCLLLHVLCLQRGRFGRVDAIGVCPQRPRGEDPLHRQDRRRDAAASLRPGGRRRSTSPAATRAIATSSKGTCGRSRSWPMPSGSSARSASSRSGWSSSTCRPRRVRCSPSGPTR